LNTHHDTDPSEFSPPLLRIRERPAPPLAGRTMLALLALTACVFLWMAFARLDIIAVADGKLVPAGYLKIVQPAEQGIVRDILVREGQAVRAGDVLIRMDAVLTSADRNSIRNEYDTRRLAMRRIDAQLSGQRFMRAPDDPENQFTQVDAQYAANVAAFDSAIAQEKSVLEKARHDLTAAEQTRAKIAGTLPHFVEQEKAFDRLAKDGFAGRILANDKARERLEREQDLRIQESIIRSNRALIEQSERRIAQITADYHRQLRTERVDVAEKLERVRQELAKHEHRHTLLELRAPQDGIVKDLATHTAGTVAAPGTILMTLVPRDGRVMAEVWLGNADVGVVRPGQPVRVKLAPFPFQKYGMVDGRVERVSADATESPSPNTRSDALFGRDRPTGPLAFRTLVELATAELVTPERRHPLAPGMQVSAEIHLGTRTILEYLLSPLQKAFHEARRER
jgi:HlyD family secretion protein